MKVLPSHNGNDGTIEVVAWSGTEIGIVQAAQVSFDSMSQTFGDREKAILRSLVKNRHGSPFEHNMIQFRVKAPIFVFREWHRHRVGISINEMSGRYTELDLGYYVPIPENIRVLVGKAMDYKYEPMPYDEAKIVSGQIDSGCAAALGLYRGLLAKGVAKEVARLVLSVNTYSMMVWTCNVRSLLHFLSLRTHPSAQFEIRQYALAMEEVLMDTMPTLMEAWNEGGRVPL